ncbi:MAG: hypothetical protein JWP92_3704 [Caulobacter sp.]|nr:hypothetical protein [Caulobacter sp.]
MNALTPLAVTAEPLLRVIASGDFTGPADLAEKAGRSAKNISRDLATYTKGGLILRDGAQITLAPAGVAALAAIDAAQRPADANPVRDAEGIMLLRHDQIHIGSLNPRKRFDPVKMEELVEDIAARGLKTNLHARALVGDAISHQLIAGERRWRAIGLAIERGLLPADFPIRVLVEEMDDKGHRLAALLENIQRDDLTPLEEAEAFDHLVKSEGLTTAEVADLAKKKSREYVQQRIRLLKLTSSERARLEDGTLSLSDARRALANRSEPVDLTPAEALVLAEVISATVEDGEWAASWREALCAGDVEEDAVLSDLVTRELLIVLPPEDEQPHFRVKVASDQAWKQINATMAEILNPATRPGALLAYRAAVVGSDAAEQADTDGKRLPPWLNEPFPLSPAQQAIADAIAAQQATATAAFAAGEKLRKRNEAEAAKRRDEEIAQGVAFLADVRAFEFGAQAALSPKFVQDNFSRLLAKHGFAAPFHVGHDGDFRSLVLIDATGKTLSAVGAAGFEALRRVQTIALNFALGAALYSGADLVEEPTEEDDGDESEEVERTCEQCSEVFDTATEELLCPRCASEQQVGEEDEEDEMLASTDEEV